MERKYGKYRMEAAAQNKGYRNTLLDDYLTGSYEERLHASDKQKAKMNIGFMSYNRYEKTTVYTLRAIRTLLKRGKLNEKGLREHDES